MNEPMNSIARASDDGRVSRGDDPEQDRIEHDRRRVVQEGLAFDQPGQTAGRRDIAKYRDDGCGIGRGDHRAEQQADDQRQARERP